MGPRAFASSVRKLVAQQWKKIDKEMWKKQYTDESLQLGQREADRSEASKLGFVSEDRVVWSSRT
jgi:hypothetical protein